MMVMVSANSLNNNPTCFLSHIMLNIKGHSLGITTEMHYGMQSGWEANQ